jgi:two-component system NtrC family sensor kinase
MPHRKPSYFWPLRLIVAASLAAPAAVLGWASWETARSIDRQADARIESSLDVLQEHAQKSLQTVERAISEINEVLRGLGDQQIVEDEADLFLRFKRTQQALPQIEAIWAFDRDGHPLVSSTILPVPRELNNSDRSYFRAQRDGDAGTFISEVVRAKVGALSFFVVSGRRGEAGRFDGVIGVTVMPDHFNEFYRKLARGSDVFAMVKADGSLLARHPAPADLRAGTGGALAAAIARSPESGLFTNESRVDGVERRLGYRKVPGFPVYVAAGIATAALRAEFWSITLTRLAVGLPVVLALFVLSLYALRRAERFQAEVVRREAAEVALKQAQRLEAIGQLTGGVAHDFNNLLMIVSGNAERLKRLPGASEERARRALQAIEIAVKRGADLTSHLLSFSRRQTHETRTVDLRERLPAVQAMLQASLRGDIAVAIEAPEGLWPVRIDVSEFELALLNLAVNARDAMPGGGTLILSAHNEVLSTSNEVGLAGEFVAVSVADSGVGIEPAVMARVFEPFFTTKEVGKGTGLGLSQVYGFARQAGGTATIRSTPGQGTVVTLLLPRAIGDAAGDTATETEAETPLQPAGARGLGVLVVEDNDQVAEVTRALLEERGYAVTPAADVATALALLRSGLKVDIVVSDVVMPGDADGLDLARTLRREFPRLPVVLASGYSDKTQAATDEGFRLLRKPFDGARLQEMVAEALAERRTT